MDVEYAVVPPVSGFKKKNLCSVFFVNREL